MRTKPVSPRTQKSRTEVARRSVLVLAAVVLVILVGGLALAIDSARLLLVKRQLANAADAASLAGADGLANGMITDTNSACINPDGLYGKKIDWAAAVNRATEVLKLNQAAGSLLRAADIEVGFWNLQTTKYDPASSFFVLNSTANCGCVNNNCMPEKGLWAPGVRVRVPRDESETGVANGGPVKLFLGPLLRIYSSSIAADSIAMQSSPGAAIPGALFPLAVGQCMFDLYWDSPGGKPLPVNLYTDQLKSGACSSSSGGSSVCDPNIKDNYIIKFSNTVSKYGNCNAGQFTSFNLDIGDSAKDIKDLVRNGNPNELSIGDPVSIIKGIQTVQYGETDKYRVGQTVLIPVVGRVPLNNDSDRTTDVTVTAFAAFYITSSVQGTTLGQNLYGKFVGATFLGKVRPGGKKNLGSASSAVLVK